MVDTESEKTALMLETRQLECVRDDRLLFTDLSIKLAAGEILQIEGANGSGKTSLLRILCGLRLAEEGDVYWQGEKVSDVREDFYNSMVYIGHLPCIKGDLTTLENIHSLLDTRSQSAPLEEIDEALAKVGLAGFDDVPSKALSSGQRRRILLAFLLLTKAKLWIMDEPLTALDVQGVALVESMLMEHREVGGSAIFTTHHGMQLPCEMSSVTLGVKC